MGTDSDLRAETREKFKKVTVTKIHGQPTHTDITNLEEELVEAIADIPTSLGGGECGHAGLIVESATYLTHSNNIPFERPTRPAATPVKPSQADEKYNVERLHNEKIRIFNLYLGVEQGLKDKILEAVDNEYLLELKQGVFGYQKVTARAMIDHLRKRGGEMDHVDIMKIRKERDEPWNGTETPAAYFARVEKNVNLLALATPKPIVTDMTEQMMSVLTAFAETGHFDAAVREWERKPTSEKTWDNIKVFINDEFCKANKSGGLTAKQAGYGSANAAQQAITDISEDHANFATNVVDVLKEVTQLAELQKVQKANHQPANPNAAAPSNTQASGGKTWAERRAERKKRFDDAPICKHCDGKHPGVPEAGCWELAENAAKRKPNWKSKKSNSE
jgi:hypothetical protein